MIVELLQRLFDLVASDPAQAERFAEDPDAVLAEVGLADADLDALADALPLAVADLPAYHASEILARCGDVGSWQGETVASVLCRVVNDPLPPTTWVDDVAAPVVAPHEAPPGDVPPPDEPSIVHEPPAALEPPVVVEPPVVDVVEPPVVDVVEPPADVDEPRVIVPPTDAGKDFAEAVREAREEAREVAAEEAARAEPAAENVDVAVAEFDAVGAAEKLAEFVRDGDIASAGSLLQKLPPEQREAVVAVLGDLSEESVDPAAVNIITRIDLDAEDQVAAVEAARQKFFDDLDEQRLEQQEAAPAEEQEAGAVKEAENGAPVEAQEAGVVKEAQNGAPAVPAEENAPIAAAPAIPATDIAPVDGEIDFGAGAQATPIPAIPAIDAPAPEPVAEETHTEDTGTDTNPFADIVSTFQTAEDSDEIEPVGATTEPEGDDRGIDDLVD